MRSRALTFLLLGAACLPATAQVDTAPTWTLVASISNHELVGEWELAQLAAGATEDEVMTSAAVAQLGVTKGSTFQIHVKLVSPQGVAQDVTGSSKLMYRPKGCLSVNASGQATVPFITQAPWTCNQGDPIPLTIIYADKPADVGAINIYSLKIN